VDAEKGYLKVERDVACSYTRRAFLTAVMVGDNAIWRRMYG